MTSFLQVLYNVDWMSSDGAKDAFFKHVYVSKVQHLGN